jgi:glutathione S-transferase
MAIAQAGSVPIKHTDNPDLAGLKPELPFGQLPYLVHGDFKLAQSNAILRYVAKLAKLEGDNEHEYGLSNMYIEEV